MRVTRDRLRRHARERFAHRRAATVVQPQRQRVGEEADQGLELGPRTVGRPSSQRRYRLGRKAATTARPTPRAASRTPSSRGGGRARRAPRSAPYRIPRRLGRQRNLAALGARRRNRSAAPAARARSLACSASTQSGHAALRPPYSGAATPRSPRIGSAAATAGLADQRDTPAYSAVTRARTPSSTRCRTRGCEP